jgi:hypothetical protein
MSKNKAAGEKNNTGKKMGRNKVGGGRVEDRG